MDYRLRPASAVSQARRPREAPGEQDEGRGQPPGGSDPAGEPHDVPEVGGRDAAARARWARRRRRYRSRCRPPPWPSTAGTAAGAAKAGDHGRRARRTPTATPTQPSASPARRAASRTASRRRCPTGCQRPACSQRGDGDRDPAPARQDAAREQAERRGHQDGHERRHRCHVVEERRPRGGEPRQRRARGRWRPPAAARRTGAARQHTATTSDSVASHHRNGFPMAITP